VLRAFAQVDVFTTTPYGGNPVAVVLDAAGLSTEEMERFARWTNLSETTFVLAPSDERADYRVRIFTPSVELPFAGHPTLGTCHAWLAAQGGQARGEVVQECAAGLVRVRRGDAGLSFAAPPLLRDGPVDEALVGRIATLLGLDRGEILDAAWADNGPGWVAVLLEDAGAVLAVRPGAGANLDLGIVGAHPPGSPAAFEVRAFFPKDGVLVEDPVTGSLNAAIAPWLLGTGRATAPYVVSQGALLGRAGRVVVERDDDGTIWVGGATVTCVAGEVEL
jgi:PhzF family phenazine biosynthesis protein